MSISFSEHTRTAVTTTGHAASAEERSDSALDFLSFMFSTLLFILLHTFSNHLFPCFFHFFPSLPLLLSSSILLCLQALTFLVALRRATSNQPSVTAAPASVGAWTNMATRSPAPENKATQTAVRPQHTPTHLYTSRCSHIAKQVFCVCVLCFIGSHLSDCFRVSALIQVNFYTSVFSLPLLSGAATHKRSPAELLFKT